MMLIAHRGLINGPDTRIENHPDTIEEAIAVCRHVEIDLRFHKGDFYLGHDKPQYMVKQSWLYTFRKHLWIHCKDLESLIMMKEYGDTYHYFWHEKDTVTLTSRNFIWAYPGNQPIYNSIAVMPEAEEEDVSNCLGICTDYVMEWLKE
jgi:hypothetical protein